MEKFDPFNKGQARSPEDIAKLSKSRVLSQAALVNEGADVTPEGRIVNVDQKEGSEVSRTGQGEEWAYRVKRSKLEAKYENILDQKLGKWRTVAETIDLGSGFESTYPKGAPTYQQEIGEIIINEGEQINVNVEFKDVTREEIRPGYLDLKVSYPEQEGKSSHHFYIRREQLKAVKIKLDKPL